ncbi:MAG: SDR family NAD(P)-dependent oxidoreductase [Candidatus Omnitrophica bacterium]|nr:SDR family NAD(P)-dependent oxidoreductase [Candidatus Omnitrophota bacterium]
MDVVKVRKAVVIGASSGIGRAVAKVLAREGYVLGLTARRTDLLEELKKEIPATCYVKHMDLRDPDEAMDILKKLIAEMGGVDLAVINSGVNRQDPNFEWEAEREVLAVNVTGFVAMANVVAQYFILQGAGHLVGISSFAGIRGTGRAPVYCASKSFVSVFLEGLRQRIGGKNIFVTDIRPGFVDTTMIQGNRYLFWVSPADRAAEQIFGAIRRKERVTYITRRWGILAWIYKLVPGPIFDWMYRSFVHGKVPYKA